MLNSDTENDFILVRFKVSFKLNKWERLSAFQFFY